jgi:hypothetical protein
MAEHDIQTQFDQQFVGHIISIGDRIFGGENPDDLSFQDRIVYESARPLYIYMKSVVEVYQEMVNIILLQLPQIKFDENCQSYNEYLSIATVKLRNIISSATMDVIEAEAEIHEYNVTETFEYIQREIETFDNQLFSRGRGYTTIREAREFERNTRRGQIAARKLAPKIRTMALKKSDQGKEIEDSCSICCENHMLLESTVTSCGHCFGRKCLEQWINVKIDAQEKPQCPLCKQEICQLVQYRPRNVSKKINV